MLLTASNVPRYAGSSALGSPSCTDGAVCFQKMTLRGRRGQMHKCTLEPCLEHIERVQYQNV